MNDAGSRGGEKCDLWVFAYGSLMWRPDFPFCEAVRARIDGLNRCFCVYSIHHRGSPGRPGLVLGLDRGGSAEGLAFHVRAAEAQGVLADLRLREQVYGVYREAMRRVAFQDGSGRAATALTYVADRAHPQFAGALPLRKQARIILGASGRSGANLDYLLSMAIHMAGLGICDRNMQRLLALAGPHLTRGGPDGDLPKRTAALARAWRRAPCSGRRIARSSCMRFAYRGALR